MELLATGFYWLSGFTNKIKSTCYSIVKSYSIVNQNIVKSEVKFKNLNFVSGASFSGARALTIANKETKNNIRIILHIL